MCRIRFGIALPVPVKTSISSLIEEAQRNELLGFDSIWASDHLLMMPPGPTPEIWSILAVAASYTSKATLGSAVSDIHRYHPAVFAQKLATIDHLSKGRISLGLGIGEAMNLEPFGFDWLRKPLAKMIEYIEVLRGLWTMDSFNFNGEFFKLKNAFLQIKPIQKTIPIYIAANSPKTRRITGRIGDGWIPTRETPETYMRNIEDVKKGAEEANRSINDIDRGLWIYTAIADEYNEALNALKAKPIKSMYAIWPKKIEEAGFKINLPEKYPQNYYMSKCMPTEEGIRDFEELANYVTDDVIEAFSICGTVDDAIGKIEKYVKAGVTHFMLVNAGPDRLKVMEAYSQKIIPYFKEYKS
ncbi:MAG: LLM class flavin-dependent oxidoreductase [Candidatus Methanomethylicia archaeon]